MTLVVSEVSGLGIVMVGDGAVTIRPNTGPDRVVDGAAKVQYARKANIGFAIWGSACVNMSQMDAWLARFIERHDSQSMGLEGMAKSLASALTEDLSKEADSGERLRRGIHIAGYVDGLPHLYHVHTGDEGTPQHFPRVFKDFPYVRQPDLDAYRERLETIGGYHLRNGYYRMFGTLFDSIYGYTEALKALDFGWPNRSLDDRASLYCLLLRFISDTLEADNRLPSVGGEIQALGFTEAGMMVDKLTEPKEDLFECGGNAEF